MLIKLIEVFELNKGSTTNLTGEKSQYSLREVFVNPNHVVCLREDELMQQHHESGMLPEKMNEKLGFTKIHIDRGHSGINITVVGNPSSIEDGIRRHATRLLKG